MTRITKKQLLEKLENRYLKAGNKWYPVRNGIWQIPNRDKQHKTLKYWNLTRLEYYYYRKSRETKPGSD